MECPKCGTRLKGGKKFCGECATELPEEFMKRVDQEFNQEREEILTPVTDKNRQSFSTPPIMDMDENRKAEDISYETGDSRKKEYKKLLLAVFADRVATADEYKLLAEKGKGSHLVRKMSKLCIMTSGGNLVSKFMTKATSWRILFSRRMKIMSILREI